jgi:hypothetical protein
MTDAARDAKRVQLDAELEKKNEIKFVHDFEKKSIGQNYLYHFVDIDLLTKEDGETKLADFEQKIRLAAKTRTTNEDLWKRSKMCTLKNHGKSKARTKGIKKCAHNVNMGNKEPFKDDQRGKLYMVDWALTHQRRALYDTMRACVLVATEEEGSCQSEGCTSQNLCWACRDEGRNVRLIPYLGSCVGHGENVNAGTLLCCCLILCPPNLTNTSLPLTKGVWLTLWMRKLFRPKMQKTSSQKST